MASVAKFFGGLAILLVIFGFFIGIYPSVVRMQVERQTKKVEHLIHNLEAKNKALQSENASLRSENLQRTDERDEQARRVRLVQQENAVLQQDNNTLRDSTEELSREVDQQSNLLIEVRNKNEHLLVRNEALTTKTSTLENELVLAYGQNDELEARYVAVLPLAKRTVEAERKAAIAWYSMLVMLVVAVLLGALKVFRTKEPLVFGLPQ